MHNYRATQISPGISPKKSAHRAKSGQGGVLCPYWLRHMIRTMKFSITSIKLIKGCMNAIYCATYYIKGLPCIKANV